MRTRKTTQRLEYLRGELRAERISYGELAELQSLASHIDSGDVELLEAAGVPEEVAMAKQKPKPVVTGEYNEREYTILVNGHPAYSAGNAYCDSQVRVPADRGVGRGNMRKFCIGTAKAVAAERKAEYGGVEYVAHDEE
jgi:hypothetical protein